MTPVQEYTQRYYLPRQLAAARAKVEFLERKALRLGLDDLVEKPGVARQ
ncbi:hypothetical protein [Novosphingobium barchaimii]|nr:hypothetical protein [Novosphingobium barchaimii]